MSRHNESRLQTACVTWFRMQYRPLAKLLFAVPNGGCRSKIEAAIMQGEGVTPGVSDLILLIARGAYHGLCIEMKTEANNSRQSDNQKAWQALVEAQGYKYIVCRTFEEFQSEIRWYMARPANNAQPDEYAPTKTIEVIGNIHDNPELLKNRMTMNDIRLCIKANIDKVFTRAGDRVEITDLNGGVDRCHIRGIVIRGDKRISHWWHRDGTFSRNPDSPLTLTIKNEKQ